MQTESKQNHITSYYSSSNLTAQILRQQKDQIYSKINEEKIKKNFIMQEFRKFKRCVAFGDVQKYKEISNNLSQFMTQEELENSYQYENQDGYSVFHTACVNHRNDLIRYLITQRNFGSKINEKTPYGDSPLHLLITNIMTDSSKDAKIFDYFIELGADVLAINSQGLDIYRYASQLTVIENYNPEVYERIFQVFKDAHDKMKVLSLYLLYQTQIGQKMPYKKLNKNLIQNMLQFI